MARRRTYLAMLGVATGAVAAVRHVRHSPMGLHAPGGVLMRDAAAYDIQSRFLLGPFFRAVAADVAAAAPNGARVLEVGCGPGHLSIRLARDHGLAVSGLDLDPAMVERARANGERMVGDRPRPTFELGDVAALPFPDGAFDLVVSTLSMHHWADPVAGATEIGRVMGPGGRALIWDIRPGVVPFHRDQPDPVERIHGSPLRVVGAAPWPWPWRLKLVQRIELVRADDPTEPAAEAR